VSALGAAWVAFATALVLTPVLARLARRAGVVDGGSAAEGERKLQERPVPPVGGVALLLALGAALLAAPDPLPWGGAELAALALAGLVGLVDDARAGGLRPLAKVAGQALAAAPLCVVAVRGGDPLGAAGLLLMALVCQNAWNTFDNADGAAAGLGALALLHPATAAAAALLGFLPWNLLGRGTGARRAPVAYLGDSGSHLVGMAILVTPAAWPALALPLLDLARVSVVRVRAGRSPFHGDRAHLAHLLQARGLGPVATLAVLLVVAAPSLAAVWPADSPWAPPGGAARGWAGAAGTAVLFVVCLAALRPREQRRGGVPPAL
jgi:UDP-GlcNAc:undecaprenyl-phosphate GlcNAc-1-phosphate transferase